MRRLLLNAFVMTSVFLLGVHARAEVTGIDVWQPESDGPRLLAPRLEGVSKQEWVMRYLRGLNASAEYRMLNSGLEIGFGEGALRFSEFAPESGEVPFAVLANRPGHMQGSDGFLRGVLNSLDSAGAKPYIIPLGLELLLTPEELADYQNRVAKIFPAMLAIGGGDIDPALYGDSIRGARQVVASRDQVEAALIRRYTLQEHGVFYGICRGSQLCAATLGFKLEQDLPTAQPHSPIAHAVGIEGARDAAHASEWHDIVISDESRFLGPVVGRSRIRVNSRHHQAVVESPNSHARVVARAEDGTVEALEFHNGRGVLFQFHPEDMGTEESRRIMREMVAQARATALRDVKGCLAAEAESLMR